MLLHVAPGGWRTTGTHIELTQLAPAEAPPLTGSSAQEAYVMHAPPAGTTPVQVSSQVSSNATSACTFVPAQSAALMAARQRPAVAAAQVAPSAVALVPMLVICAMMSASQAPVLVPPDA
jgi:hypothetical protein